MTSGPDANLARLLQLASPTLPVGAYSYSQGLEAAVDAGVVRNAETAVRWIGEVLEHVVARMEAPTLLRLMEACREGDDAALARWNALYLASRETAELRAETVQMGYSLARLLNEIGDVDKLDELGEISFPAAFARAAAQWRIDSQQALIAYLWAWLENQVMAAVKAVPLGQTDGQRILLSLGDRLLPIVEEAMSVTDDELGSFAPQLAILSCRHETQYSRLFRS